MNKYRYVTLALAAGAASLAVAGCSSGTPSASSSSPATATGTAAPVISAPVPTTGAPIAGRTVEIKGKLGGFPVPVAAKVGENSSGGSSLIVVFGSVTPADVARFYATALPRAGFTVTSNSLVSQGGQPGALIAFNGHGYKGNIQSVAQFPVAVVGVGNKNVTSIIMSPAA